MEVITCQKTVVKGKKHTKSWFKVKDDLLLNHMISFPPSPIFFKNKNHISRCSEIKKKQNRRRKLAYSLRVPGPGLRHMLFSITWPTTQSDVGVREIATDLGPAGCPRRLSSHHQIRTAQTLEECVKCLAFVEHF